MPDIFGQGAGIFDIEPYQNPNPDEPANPDDVYEHAKQQWEENVSGGSSSSGSSRGVGRDSGEDAISELAKELNVNLDDTTKDYLLQYYFGNKSSEAAFNRELNASSSQYQRAVADLRKAGLNPFLALDSLRGSGASSSGGSITGGLLTSKKNTEKDNATKYGTSILGILAMIAAAAMYAMA